MPTTKQQEKQPRASPQPADIGLRCKRCGCRDLRVIETRRTWANRIRRRRECRHCGERCTSMERLL